MNFQEAMILCEKEGKKVRAELWLKMYYIEFNKEDETFYLVNGNHKEVFKYKVDYFYENFELHKEKVKKYLHLVEILPTLEKGTKVYSDGMQKGMYLYYNAVAGSIYLMRNTATDINYSGSYGDLFNGSWYIIVDEGEI